MIVRCIRCNTEFDSSHSHTHACPNCHFVFSKDNGARGEFKIVRSSDLVRESTGRHLLGEGAHRCAFHPDADAIEHCKSCGRPICYVCATVTESEHLCEFCASGRKPGAEAGQLWQPPVESQDEPQVETEESKATTISQAMAKQPYVAWEYRSSMGRLNALFATWRQTLFRPVSFFRNAPLVGDYRSPVLYGLFWTLVGLTAGAAWKLLFYTYPTLVMFFKGTEIQFSLQLSRTYMLATAALLLSPLFALIMVLVACTIYHVFIMVFTRQHAGFEATLRVVCYSTGTNVFHFLPLLGGLLGGLWQLILVTLGFKEVHRISFPFAVIVTLVPYTLLLTCWIAFIIWAVAGSGLGLTGILTDIIRSLMR
jgi:hypothetical protein